MIEIFRSSCPEVFCKEGVLKNFAKIHRKTPVPETMAQVFSCEFCEISKNTFFYRTPSGGCFYIIKNENTKYYNGI